MAQYRRLKAVAPACVDFPEDTLNGLGYQLIHGGRFKEAIRILELNTEAYPHSANAYASLAEAYMDDGDRAGAVANYRTSLRLYPGNRNARDTLAALGRRWGGVGGALSGAWRQEERLGEPCRSPQTPRHSFESRCGNITVLPGLSRYLMAPLARNPSGFPDSLGE